MHRFKTKLSFSTAEAGIMHYEMEKWIQFVYAQAQVRKIPIPLEKIEIVKRLPNHPILEEDKMYEIQPFKK